MLFPFTQFLEDVARHIGDRALVAYLLFAFMAGVGTVISLQFEP